YKDIQKQPKYGHNETRCLIVAIIQELRHRKDFILQIHGNKPYGNDNKRNRSNNLVGCHGYTYFKTVSAHSDKLLCRDIGSNQGRSDSPPSQRTFCKKIILTCVLCRRFLTVDPVAVSGYNKKVDYEDNVVYCCKFFHVLYSL